LLSTGVVLIDRILEAKDLQQEIGIESPGSDEIRLVRGRILIETSRLTSQNIATELNAEINSESPSLPVIFQRTLALYGKSIGVGVSSTGFCRPETH
jgi:hypothetical protein